MGAEIITTNQTSQYLIQGGDFVVLMPDVTLTIEATTATGFLANTNSNFTLTVLGQVVTYGKAADLGLAANDVTLAALDVGEGGLMQSLTDVAVEVRRNNNMIDNAGTITGGAGGIRYGTGVAEGKLTNSGTISSFLGPGIVAGGAAGGGVPGRFTVVNTGAIEAATTGVSIGNESLALTNHGDIIALGTGVRVTDDPSLANILTLVNTGLIQGATTAIEATGHADSVTNSGTLLGAVLLGEGDNVLRNWGDVFGAVGAGAGADILDNTGAVSAAVDLGAGANRITNAGRLAELTAGGGDDAFTNELTGVVTGLVDLGDGANAVTNHGQLAAGLALGSGDDTLLSTGTITGPVTLGDGTNTATFNGALFGALVGGVNADIIKIRGSVAGDITLDDGADSLINTGRIEGNVDMGAGADFVRLTARAEATGGSIDGGSGEDTLASFVDVEDVFNFEIIRLKGSEGLGVIADAIDNIVFGNTGANEIDGGDGADQLYGGGGGDTLLGGLAADILMGGRGADELIGGEGADILYGGRGRDVFAYEAVTDSAKGVADHIVDFERGRDKVDLSALVDGSVSWLGTGRFTRSGVAEARYTVVDGDLNLKLDVNGDGVLDMAIILEDLAGIGAADFLL